VDSAVGNKLREGRGRRGLSLEEVEAETKIRVRYLQAIENEEWDQLPEDTYTRAFIRTYARFLGLDGDRLAEDQRRSRGAARPGERLPRVDPRPRPVVRKPKRRRGGISPRVVAAVVTAVVVAALLAIGLATGGGDSETADKGDGSGKAETQRAAPGPHVGQAVPLR
jgi:cytoskeletal protein RodZ